MSSIKERSLTNKLLVKHLKNVELDEFLQNHLSDAGFGGFDIQRNPLGTKINIFVNKPGIAIGKRGTGIKKLTEDVLNLGFINPQISVSEIEHPDLNPNIIVARLGQGMVRGFAFRRSAQFALNNIMKAGALGVEIVISGKLRSDRARYEKFKAGVVPKSGEVSI